MWFLKPFKEIKQYESMRVTLELKVNYRRFYFYLAKLKNMDEDDMWNTLDILR